MNDYDTYLQHHFDGCRRAIRDERLELLKSELKSGERLIQKLIDANEELTDVDWLWRYIREEYITLHARTVELESVNMRAEVTASFKGIISYAYYREEFELAIDLIEKLPTFYEQSFRILEYDDAKEKFLRRVKEVFDLVSFSFRDATDLDTLCDVKERVERVLSVYARLLKITIEYRSVDAFDFIRHQLANQRAFDEYEYIVHSPSRIPEGVDQAFMEDKQEHADDCRHTIQEILFASYGWSLYLELDGEEEDSASSFLETVITEYLPKDFGTITEFSRVYFRLCSNTPEFTQFENWEMERELDQNYGVATTGMAVNTWLLQFYSIGLVLLANENELDRLDSAPLSSGIESEIEGQKLRIDKVISSIESLENDFPLDEFIDKDPPATVRCRKVIHHFKQLRQYEEQRRVEQLREESISQERCDQFEDAANQAIESSRFRKALIDTFGIEQRASLESERQFTLRANLPRRLFIDQGGSLWNPSNFQWLTERYREFVIDGLNMDEEVINSIEDLPDKLSEIAASNDINRFVVQSGDARRVLSEDPRTSRTHESDTDGSLRLEDAPIVTEPTNRFTSVVIYKESFKYFEQADDQPVSISVTPGEEALSESNIPDGDDVRDYVLATFEYKANFQIPEDKTIGTVIQVRNQ